MIEAAKLFLSAINILFIVYLLGYMTFLFVSVVSGVNELYEGRKRAHLHNYLHEDLYLPVSIIIPAYNERVVIESSVRSLLELDYKIYEIIIVDDGSTDGMADHLVELFNMKQINRPIRLQIACKPIDAIYESMSTAIPLTLIRKENGGKADALNVGINAARYPFFVSIDADSILETEALKKVAQSVLESDNVIAAGGAVRPANNLTIHKGRLVRPTMPKNVLACMQVLEFDRSFLASRIFLDRFNANMIISGAFGLFKKDVVIAAGGFEVNTVGEDMEIVMKLHNFCITQDIPYKIKYVPEAVCWTQMPTTLRDLTKQRRRWHLGLFQSMYKYRHMLLRPGAGFTSWVSYLYYLLYELFSPFIELLGIAATLLAIAVGLINWQFMLLFYGIYVAFGWAMSLTAFFSRIHAVNLHVTGGDVCKALLVSLIESTGLRFILMLVRAMAFWGYKKKRLQWSKVNRQKVNIR